MKSNRPVLIHVVESFSGGTLESVAQLCHTFSSEIDITVLHGIRPDTPENFADKFPADVKLVRWSTPRGFSPWGILTAIMELRRLTTRLDPIFVHAHSTKAGAFARVAFPLGGRRVLYSPRGYAFLRTDIPAFARAIIWGIERLLGILPHTIVACGHEEYKFSAALCRDAKMVLNAVSVAELEQVSSDIAKAEVFRVVTAGRIAPQKNFQLFAEIADELANEGIEFVWIGGGTPPDSNFSTNISITGHLSRSECIQTMATGHVYIQTSKWEGLSRAILEAMALGLPVLLTPVAGNREMVAEGVNGQLCSTSGEFVAAIRQLRDDADQRSRFGAASHDIISKNHDVAQIRKQWVSVYGL